MRKQKTMSKHAETTQKLIPDYHYHIYGRGNNGQKIYFKRENYRYFLKRYAHYTKNYFDTLSYCLIPNHFHFLIRIKSTNHILNAASKEYKLIPKALQKELVVNGFIAREHSDFKTVSNDYKNLRNQDINFLSNQSFTFLVNHPHEHIRNEVAIWLASNQLRLLFVAYAKAINKQEGRSGSLFESPFRRKLVDDLDYLIWLVWYLHRNPLHHKLTKNFSAYEHSSYQSLLSKKPSLLKREEVFSYFDSKEDFEVFHLKAAENWEEWERFVIE